MKPRLGQLQRLLQQLESPLSIAHAAQQAHYSRHHASRAFAQATGESPKAFRKRLLLERAALELQGGCSVISAALNAGYQSPEAFSRSFRQAYGVSPSHYQRIGTPSYFLPSPNGLHYQAPRSSPGAVMDLQELLLQHDTWMVEQLLKAAQQLPVSILDQTLPQPTPLPFGPPPQTLRQLLQQLVYTQEVWLAAVRGQSLPAASNPNLEELLERHREAAQGFMALAKEVQHEGQWHTVFVDALCIPPETFSLAGMIAHVITFRIQLRFAVLHTLQSLGVAGLGYGDPIEFERSQL